MRDYTHLSEKEREIIAALLQNGKNQTKIAKELGRDPGTISREIQRNKTMVGIKNNNNPTAKKYIENMCYFPDKAQKKYNERRFESKQGCPLKTLDLYDYVIKKLKKGWSPDLISGRAKLEGIGNISHECIYQFIYGKCFRSLKLWEYLARNHRKRRKKHGRKGKRTLIPNKICIDYRPHAVEDRIEFGHWEGDSIVGVGKGSALHTQIERKSRYIQIQKISRKGSKETADAMINIFEKFPEHARKTSTEDNGCEFTQWERVSSKLKMDIYFAHAYHSWERGSNERGNGLVRRFLPKKTNFDDVPEDKIKTIEFWINHRPMKCLEYKTPHEVFHENL